MRAFGILILLGIAALLIAPVSMASGFQPSNQPVLFGKAANNGDLLGLYYTDPLGQTIMSWTVITRVIVELFAPLSVKFSWTYVNV